ncbi:thiamine pyrophosphate-binding protein [[Mycobacterium] wendilense]|uniref:acetolactate synthase n=1 Tax=[Mycobacterium] wendilense TaxID=3064284 RepID=A0ABM9MDE8_9MYCO|nr:thiamine pyrophosphate-dependent enzyme [Mycolicibacterium sp. MU0050]CAJ1582488.1 thiamine pyrophosphate-binding protein [Mycolicibacterium sp. MU0050]
MTPAIVRVADHILAHLAAGGVTHVFGVDGENVEDLFDAAHFREDITAVLAKHEFAAAAMADGYSRAGAGLGVVMASGGAALNLIPSLGESLASRVPVLALVGQPPSRLDGFGAAGDTSGRNGSLNAQALFRAVSVFCERVTTPEHIRTALPRAIIAACAGGPAVLLLPKDIQQAQLDLAAPQRDRARTWARRPRLGDVHPLTRALRSARGTVAIVAGEQVARDGARAELESLRATLSARVACVPEAKDVTPEFTGALGITGAMGHPAVADAVADSAVCLLVGTRLPLTARTGLDAALRNTRTFSIGSAPPHLPCTHVHTDDLQASLAELTRKLSGRGRPRGLRIPEPTPPTELTPPRVDGAGVGYRQAMKALDAALPANVDVVVDAGNAGTAALHYLPARRGGRFLVALGMGAMGYSFGAGIGMAIARRRRTVVIAGDGAFYTHGMELHTAIEHQLPVTVVLFNNNAHAMSATRERLYYGDLHSYNRFRPSHLGAGLAAMFPGLRSVDVTDIGALPSALAEALEAPGPSVISVECSADEIPPFAPFLEAVASPVGDAAAPAGEDYLAVPASA